MSVPERSASGGRRALLPHPFLFGVLFGLWLLLQGSLSAGQLLLGAIVAFVLPRLADPLLPVLPRVRRPLGLVAYVGLVLGDIVTSNLRLVPLVLGPASRLHPAVVTVPLDVDDPVVAWILAMTVTLTPGTASIELDLEARQLLVHGLDAPDADALAADIKGRYERRLKEIFEC